MNAAGNANGLVGAFIPFDRLNRRNDMTTLIHANIPDQLARQAQQMVDHGWAVNMEFVVTESLPRYL
jgi:hypothetical protein